MRVGSGDGLFLETGLTLPSEFSLDARYIIQIWVVMADLRTNMMDFRGFDSSKILIIRVGILMPTGNFPEDLSQAILVGIMLVGRMGPIMNESGSPSAAQVPLQL